MRCCISGGMGFIGTRLCEKMLELGHQVIVIDKLTYAANQQRAAELSNHPNYNWIEGDVCDDRLVFHVLKQYECEAIMHLAAESHVDRSISWPQTFLDANVLGTYGVLEAIRAYMPIAPPGFRLVHVSTDEVFGDLALDSPHLFTEDSRYNPSSPYSASKAAADHLVRAWGRTFGVPFLITHGANAYGQGQLPDKLVPMCITRGLRGEPITINGTGLNVRSWLHVDDHVSGLIAVLERGKIGEAYCLSSGEEVSNLAMAHMICALLGDALLGDLDLPHWNYHEQITYTADRPGNDMRYAISGHKMKRDLGWVAQRKLVEALRETVEWYIKQETR